MKKKLMKTAMLLSMAVLVAAFGLAGCGSGNGNNSGTTGDTAQADDGTGGEEAGLGTEGTEGTTGEGDTGSGDILTDYNTMLQGAGSQDDIYGFLDENIANATTDETDQMISGLIGYTGMATAVDYTRLSEHSSYLSDEMGRFVELMRQEQETPSVTSDEGNQLSVTELLNRATEFETLMNDYPDGVTQQYAYEMYEQIMSAAITGGYDAGTSAANQYLSEDGGTIGENYLTEYNDFVGGEQSGTRTAQIVSDYVGMYDDKGTVTDDITSYFNNFATKLKEAFMGEGEGTDGGSAGGTAGGTGTGTGTTGGTGTGTTGTGTGATN